MPAFLLCVCVALMSQESWARPGKTPRILRNPAPAALATAPPITLPGHGGLDFSDSSYCLVNGITMFEGAVWAPGPCSVCICDRGKVSCDRIPCRTTDPVLPAQKDNNPGAEVMKVTPKPEAAKNKIKSKPKPDKTNKLQQATSSPKQDTSKKAQEVKTKKVEIISTTRKEVASGKQEFIPEKKQDVVQKPEGKGVKPTKEKVGGGGGGSVTDIKKSPVRPTVTKAPYVRSRHQLITFDDFDDNIDSHDLEDLFLGRPFPGDRLHPNIMESLPIGCLLSESAIACGNSRMRHVPILTDLGITTLYLAENEIAKIPPRTFAGLPNLEWLDLSKNRLDDSSLYPDIFRNLTKLKRLNLDGNHITKIPPLPPSLEELKMNDNKISGLTPQSFKGLFKLLTLELEGNGFHDGNVSPLAFRPLKKLIYLRLDENKFRAIPSGLPASLQELHMDENHIEEIHEGVLNKTVNLKVLDLSNNRIQENRIAPRAWIHLQQLESIDLSYNRLVHVPSFLPMGLRQLILHHNQIERIPGYVFAHLRPGLEFLHLSHNHLRDDGIHGVSFLGLYRSLTELLLDNNHLRAIPRGLLNLRFLQVLRLNDNHIRYVPLNSICDTRVMEDSPLISIHLENNLIDRRLIPPTAFSCIRSYHSIILRPQSYEE